MSGSLLPTATGPELRSELGRRLRDRRPRLLAALALFAGSALAGLAGPALVGRLVDVVDRGHGGFGLIAIGLLGATVLQALLAWAAPVVGASATEPALAELREDVVDRALHLSAAEVERGGTGDLVARVDGDVEALSEAVSGALPDVVGAALTIGLSLLAITALDWRLGLAAACAVPIQLHTVRWYLPQSGPMYAKERIVSGARSQQLLEAIGSARVVRALGLAPRQGELVAQRSGESVQLVIDITRVQTRFFARLNLAEVVGLSAILLSGFYALDHGAVTIGEVTAAALFFQRLFDPINSLLFQLDKVQSAAAAFSRLVGITRIEVPAPPIVHAARRAALKVEHVSFAYDAGHPAVRDLSFSVAPGEHLAVVGASGAGKSTLAKLIAGLQRPDAGQVRLGRESITALATVKGAVPVVLVTQEVHVFAGPLADDLRLAAPDATDDQLRAVLERVGALEWVDQLPDGLATEVGDGGHTLTGLQSQQVALARLLLVDPAVVVLDEATAEAGSTGARSIDAAAAEVLRGRTAIVIAHRLSQAATADRILVLDAGRAVELGTHAELLRQQGTYAHLWQAWSQPRG